jgi:hypothetical protein
MEHTALMDTTKEAGLEANKEKLSTCLCLITKMQDKNHNLKQLINPSKSVSEFKYLGMTVTQKHMKYGKCLLPFSPESSVSSLKMYRTIILPSVLYDCETWALILREEHRLKVFEKRVLEEYLDLRGMKWWEAGENCTVMSFIIKKFALIKQRHLKENISEELKL